MQVHLWDYDQLFREARAVDASGLSLRGVMFDFTAPPDSSRLNQADSSQCTAVPDLIRVAIALLHALQIEPEHTAKVCMNSLFKIALWCPRDKHSPLRDLIRDEFCEISSSAFGLTHPSVDSQEGGPFDVFRSATMADPRSCLANLDRMGLGAFVDRPDRPPLVEYSTCHYGARKWSCSWHSSAVCREALLYSLALESMSIAAHPPRVLTLNELHAKAASGMAESDDSAIGGDLFDVAHQASDDLIGDIIDMPMAEPHQDTSAALDGSVLCGTGGENSKFVVDNDELKNHMYLLTRLIN